MVQFGPSALNGVYAVEPVLSGTILTGQLSKNYVPQLLYCTFDLY